MIQGKKLIFDHENIFMESPGYQNKDKIAGLEYVSGLILCQRLTLLYSSMFVKYKSKEVIHKSTVL